jgi:hypothetical protein
VQPINDYVLTPYVRVDGNKRIAVAVHVLCDGRSIDFRYSIQLHDDAVGRELAARLMRAILAGKVFIVDGINIDANGREYVVSRCNVLGRTLNADLARLGY